VITFVTGPGGAPGCTEIGQAFLTWRLSAPGPATSCSGPACRPGVAGPRWPKPSGRYSPDGLRVCRIRAGSGFSGPCERAGLRLGSRKHGRHLAQPGR
jgi:hypothetical protein